MIVSDDTVSRALQYLAEDPHPLAVARHELTIAENLAKELYANAFLSAEGSVEARRATAEIDPAHRGAKKREAEAVLELERHKARTRAAEMIIEIWRTDNANARAAERVR